MDNNLAGASPADRAVRPGAYARLLADVLRAEAAGEDLHDGGHCIHVCAMRQDRTLYEIGRVSASLVYQRPDAARAAIERIKFRKA